MYIVRIKWYSRAGGADLGDSYVVVADALQTGQDLGERGDDQVLTVPERGRKRRGQSGVRTRQAGVQAFRADGGSHGASEGSCSPVGALVLEAGLPLRCGVLSPHHSVNAVLLAGPRSSPRSHIVVRSSPQECHTVDVIAVVVRRSASIPG